MAHPNDSNAERLDYLEELPHNYTLVANHEGYVIVLDTGDVYTGVFLWEAIDQCRDAHPLK